MNSRFTRLVTLVFAAIQFAAPAVASVGEGLFSNRVVDARPHVEDKAHTDCRAPHSADCAVCRYLVDNAGTLAAPAVPVAIATEQLEPVVSGPQGATADRQTFEARGPPATAG
jgi:hypothetical protein